MAGLIARQLSQKLYASAWRAISSRNKKPYWTSKFPDGQPRSFEEIPVAENSYYDERKIHENSMQLFTKYGHIVREQETDNVDLVHLFHLEDFQTIYDYDERFPTRKKGQSIKRFLQNSGHLLDWRNEEWRDLREFVHSRLMQEIIQTSLEAVTDDLVQILNFKSKELEINILPWLFRWAVESAGVVTLNRRMGALSEPRNEDVENLIESAIIQNEMITLTKIDWENLEHRRKAQMNTGFYINRKMYRMGKEISMEQDEILAEAIKKHNGFSRAAILAINVFKEDLQTVPLTVLMALYNLALYKHVQDSARAEVIEILPEKGSKYNANVQLFRDIPRYLKGIVCETVRMNPPVIGTGRTLHENLVLGAYLVPKWTNVILHHHVAFLQDEFFEEPLKFKPERHPTVYIEHLENVVENGRYGLGTTFCLNQMVLVLAKILRNFEVSYVGGEIKMITGLHNEPEKPLYLTLKKVA